MTFSKVSIYPYGRSKRRCTKRLKSSEIYTESTIIRFIHEKYLQLLNENVNINDILSDTINKLVVETNSKAAFLSMVNKQEQTSERFNYYCIYIEGQGLHFAPFEKGLHPHNMNSPNADSILVKSIEEGCVIISNDVETDTRFTTKLPATHIKLITLALIPLVNINNQVIGQLCLANSDKYILRMIEKIVPIIYFLNNFGHMCQSRKNSISNELKLKHEVLTMKDSFIATMSHEIRTPLNGIVGMCKLLSESDNLTEKQEKYLTILTECSIQLMELVNDILDYSKMTTGHLILNNYPFNLRSCIDKTIEIIRPRVEEKKLELKVNIPDNLPENVSGDSRRLKQVLFNLFTNAIKFTDTGSITLTVEFENMSIGTSADTFYNKSKRIIFHIKDTGIGISPAFQQNIFDVFTKLNESEKNYLSASPGAGMGLSISKYIVEGMGGKISVDSDGKNGSTFTFDVFLDDETDIVHLLELHGAELKNKVAIIVDDNEDNRIFLMDCLFSWGIQAHVFGSAREALKYLEKKPIFHIIIVDLCMPNMSGIEFVQSMREFGFTQPVIGLSSIGFNIAGKEWFDYFVTKPIGKSNLFNLILRCLLHKNTQSKPNIVSTPKSNQIAMRTDKDMRIIIAEDDYYNQIVLSEILNSLGYNNLTIVSNGKTCVEKVKKESFQLCLMDIKMPVLDGLEATRQIKKLANPPFVVGVSASVLDSDKNKCYAAGMDGYIPKPVQKDRLNSLLNNLNSQGTNRLYSS